MIDTNPPNPHDDDEREEPGSAQSGFTHQGAPTEPTEGRDANGSSNDRDEGVHLDGLTPAQANAVIALLNEPNIARAAKAAGVGERTIHSWLDRDDAFIAAYRKARRQTFGTAIALTARFAPMAVNVLAKVMVDTQAPYASRVAAASNLLRFGRECVELDDLAQRVEALERLQNVGQPKLALHSGMRSGYGN